MENHNTTLKIKPLNNPIKKTVLLQYYHSLTKGLAKIIKIIRTREQFQSPIPPKYSATPIHFPFCKCPFFKRKISVSRYYFIIIKIFNPRIKIKVALLLWVLVSIAMSQWIYYLPVRGKKS